MPGLCQSLGERGVLERSHRLEAADRAIHAGGDSDRSAREVMMGGARIALTDPFEPLGGVALATAQHLRGEANCFLRRELDQSGDRTRTGTDVRELAREPVRGGPGVGVRARHKSVVESVREQPLGGHIHPGTSRRARAGAGPVEQREPEREPARGVRGDVRGPVGARIEHDDHLELVSRHRLGPQRGHAPRDLVFLVTRRDDHDAR